MNRLFSFLNNKTIVIFGATGGIGEEFSKQCREYSDNIVLISRNITKLQNLSKKLDIKYYYDLDINDYNKYDEIINNIEDKIGNIDIAVNFIGYDVFDNIWNIPTNDIIKTSRINFEGSIILAQTILKKYLKRGNGVMANVNAFSNGVVPFPYYSIDSASRAGIASFYRSMRKEISTYYPQIRFILFSPPITDTEMERSRISSKVWKKLKMKFHSPENVVRHTLLQIAKGKNDIIPTDEFLLSIADIICNKLSDIFFFNGFRKAFNNVINKN